MFNFKSVIFSPKISFIGAFRGQMVINFGTTGFGTRPFWYINWMFWTAMREIQVGRLSGSNKSNKEKKIES